MFGKHVMKLLAASFLLVSLLLASCSGKKEVRSTDTFDPEKLLARANELIEKKDFDEARKILLEVKNRDISKKYAPLAQLKLADSYFRDEEYDIAIDEYRRFLDIYPDNKYASYAQYQIAMVYFSQIEGPERGYGAAEKALKEFEKLMQLFPRNPYREAVEIKMQQCKNIMADYEFLVAEFYLKKGSYHSVIRRLETILKKFPDYKKIPLVYYYMALSLKHTGDNDRAREYLNMIIEKYPDDRITKEAKKELSAIK
ncbi:MAG: outer membrane protein assembly factor BamD [Thermodesulfovibrionales bacterium]